MKKIKKEKFYGKLNSLIGEYDVYAPKGDRIEKIKNVDEISIETLLTRLPSKSFFLPQNEELFRWDKDKNIKIKSYEKKTIIFGVRPCDARAIASLDPTFDTKEFPDTYYQNKRKHSIIISIGCNEPDETCFCSSFGSGPFDQTNSDLLLMEINGDFVATGKKELLELFEFEDGDMEKAYNETKQRATEKVEKIEIKNVAEKLDGLRESEFFKDISAKCVNCGACTFLCPTCYCFDIEDMKRIDGGKRVRNWDSCMFTVYTSETSGNNPRKQEELRMRQRIMHKFNYYPVLYDTFGCVGCGRCVIYCPVNFDIRNVLKKVEGFNE